VVALGRTGSVRTNGTPWSAARFHLDERALCVERPEHPQPRIRIRLDHVRALEQVGEARAGVVEVELTTTTGTRLQLRWPEPFNETVLEELVASLHLPPRPLPVPAWCHAAAGPFPGLPTVGAPDLREASAATLPTRHPLAAHTPARRGRHPVRWSAAALAAVGVLVAGDGVALHSRIERVDAHLPGAEDGVRTWLLVGSDSRAAAAGMPDPAVFGTPSEVRGERADVILLVQEARDGGAPRVLSVPRDLLVFREGLGIDRLGLSLLDGEDGLVLSICRSLGVSVDHVVKVRFDGVRDLVDAVGGVEVDVPHPTRDLHTGLSLDAGRTRVDGAGAIAWMRARHVEQLVDGRWVPDPASDTGRQQHQREVLDQLTAAMARRARNPVEAQRLAWTTTGAVTTDGGTDPLDLVRLALTLRRASDQGSLPHTLVDGRIPVATLDPEAQQVLDDLRHDAPVGPPCPRPDLGT